MKSPHRHRLLSCAAMSSPAYRNLLQWQAARAKYEYRLRQNAAIALDYAQMCCGWDSDTAIREIESIIRFHLTEWEDRNPKPNEK